MLYCTICSALFTKHTMEQIVEIKEDLSSNMMWEQNPEICATARLTTWFFEYSEEGIIAQILYANFADGKYAKCANPELFEMAGPVEAGRHYRNTYARGKALLDALKERYEGVLANTLG